MCTPSKKQLVSIMTPCYNEQENLELLYERLRQQIEPLQDRYDFEWLVIDNASTDDSRSVLRSIAARDRRVKVIFNARNFGPARSACHGLLCTSGDAAIVMAADFQEPCELIPQFITLWEQGYHVVLGHIIQSGESRLMWLVRTLYYRIINHFSENDELEHVTGFGLYDRMVIEEMRRESNPNPNFRNTVVRMGYHIGLVDYTQPIRRSGMTSYSFGRRLDTAIDALVQTSYRPVRIILKTGTAITLISVAAIIAFIATALSKGHVDLQVLTLLAITLFAGLVAMAIGITGEYVVAALAQARNHPLVFEEERINFSHAPSLPDAPTSHLQVTPPAGPAQTSCHMEEPSCN